MSAAATIEQARRLRLTEEEFSRICEVLGRTPNFAELCIYSAMWSEHCSYKNSILWLKKLPKEGQHVLAKAGEENAGLVDIGEGWAVAFKIESHNHPSALEPFQGAATGVGGIHRDIFTMGARPIATLNSLRFGDPSLPRTKFLLRGAMAGIGHYGNCFGVPTVGGEIFFDPSFNTNPLVNAMSVGVVRVGETISATAKGVHNPVFIVGAATGKDGIGGASFASDDISADSANELPAVQVGDPFTQKILLEATLEAIRTGAVVGMQDMGAAGIACSTSEMAAKGGVGMDIHLDRVPKRQADMLPFELLISESQERMLIVAHAGREDEVRAVFDKWDLPCVQIGTLTDGPLINYYMHGELAAQVPAESLVLGGGAPVYRREMRKPAYFAEIEQFREADVPQPPQLSDALQRLAAHPNLASKRALTRIYDSMVGASTVSANRPSDAAVVHVPGTNKSIAMTTDCNPRWVYLNPERGCALAVAEAARNLVCAGASPLGITNCLNFGNPFNEEVYYQFAHSILGMKAACEAFGLPVTGGNVSFYNQSAEAGPVFPTPTIGMVGLLENAPERMGTLDFKAGGHAIYLLGEPGFRLGGSEYVYSYHGIRHSPCPHLDLEAERRLQLLVLQLVRDGLLQSAHDVADGGLWMTLLESALHGDLGFDVDAETSARPDAFLFSEDGGRVVVSVAPEREAELISRCGRHGVPCLRLGTTGGHEIKMWGTAYGDIESYKNLYFNSLPRLLS